RPQRGVSGQVPSAGWPVGDSPPAPLLRARGRGRPLAWAYRQGGPRALDHVAGRCEPRRRVPPQAFPVHGPVRTRILVANWLEGLRRLDFMSSLPTQNMGFRNSPPVSLLGLGLQPRFIHHEGYDG